MSIHLWRGILIDRFGVTLKVTSKKLYWQKINSLFAIKLQEKILVPNGQIKVSKEQYKTRLDYYPSVGRKAADITLATNQNKYRYLRIGIILSAFHAEEFATFKLILSSLLQVEYEVLYNLGHVTYLEIAVDSLSHVAHSFLPTRKQCNASFIYKDASGYGTTYIGDELSALQFRIYDKRKQQLETGQIPTYSKHTRIEARLKHLGIPPCKLSTISNPFLRLFIVDIAAADKLSNEQEWKEFLCKCRYFGSPSALKGCSKATRKKFNQRLATAPVSWWRPNKHWQRWPNALVGIAP